MKLRDCWCYEYVGALLLLGSMAVYGQEVVYKDQVTVQWDAVAETGGAIGYEVYVSDHPVVDPQDPNKHTSLGVTPGLEFVVDIAWNSQRAIGVRSIMTLPDATMRYSDINWSDSNGEGTPSPFLLVSVQSPAMPIGLGIKE